MLPLPYTRHTARAYTSSTPLNLTLVKVGWTRQTNMTIPRTKHFPLPANRCRRNCLVVIDCLTTSDMEPGTKKGLGLFNTLYQALSCRPVSSAHDHVTLSDTMAARPHPVVPSTAL